MAAETSRKTSFFIGAHPKSYKKFCTWQSGSNWPTLHLEQRVRLQELSRSLHDIRVDKAEHKPANHQHAQRP
jgi:hypothetical protein